MGLSLLLPQRLPWKSVVPPHNSSIALKLSVRAPSTAAVWLCSPGLVPTPLWALVSLPVRQGGAAGVASLPLPRLGLRLRSERGSGAGKERSAVT